MRFARALVLGVAAALLGAVALLARAPDAVLAPTGPYQVRHGVRMLETPGGAYRIHVWEPAGAEGTVPLVLYAPGWGGGASDSAVLLKELASHGYLTVSFDDPALDPRSARESGQDRRDLAAGANFDSPEAYRESFELGSRRVALAARKSREILDGILAAPDIFSRIDPARIGFVGYSFGGATGVEHAFDDARIKAVVNLDGWLFGKSARQPPAIPYLLFYVDEDFPPPSWLSSGNPGERGFATGAAFDQQLHRPLLARDDFFWLWIRGFAHRDLSDETLHWNWREPLHKPASANPDFMARKKGQLAIVRGFLDRFLKGETMAFPPAGRSYPDGISEVSVSDLMQISGQEM